MIEQDLGQIIPDITATATIDNTTGTPECNITVEEIEELGKLINKFKFSFLHLKGEKGDKPQKGVDYYTPQEKEQFTTETKALVTGEGSKQVSLINAETAKVIQQVRDIVAGNEATSNALTLSGKTRAEFEKDTQGVAGGFSGTFPLTQATLNGIYLLPGTGKFYVCTKEYNGKNLTAPNGNFEELSVFKNRDRLENLWKRTDIDKYYDRTIILFSSKQRYTYIMPQGIYLLIQDNWMGVSQPAFSILSVTGGQGASAISISDIVGNLSKQIEIIGPDTIVTMQIMKHTVVAILLSDFKYYEDKLE